MDAQDKSLMPKRSFILIDQSIMDFSGHHYEYAHRVLKSAEKSGFEPVLVTNRKFNDQSKVPFKTYSIYKYGLWLTFSKPGFLKLFEKFQGWLHNRWIHIKAKMAFSTYAMLWLNRSDIPKDLSILSKSRFNLLNILFLGIAVLLGIILKTIRIVWLLIPFKSYFGQIFKMAGQAFSELFKPLKLFFQPNNPIQKAVGLRIKIRAFTRDTARLLKLTRLSGEDIVFIPTLGTEELAGLIPILKNTSNRQTGWHLLFRRNAYIGRNPEYQAQEESLRRFKNQFKHIFQEVGKENLFFYTDTEELTNQYNRFGTFTFKTLPIPAADDVLAPGQTNEDNAPLNIIYTGDARTEKGYHFFPNIIRDLSDPYVLENKIRFSLQSNFNIPGGEPRPRIAKADLVQMQGENLELIDKILSTSEYEQLLQSGDIIPILYDAENYYARSSGIFVEALVLGKPVMVPAGTWMAKELNNAINDYHNKVIASNFVSRKRTMQNTFWHVNGKPKSIANDENRIILVRNHVKYSYLAVPRGSTHMIIRFNQSMNSDGNFVKIFLQELINQEKPVRHQTRIVGGQTCTTSHLFTLSSYTRRIWTGLSNAYSNFPLELEDIEIQFLAIEKDIPLSSVGVIYSDENEIGSELKELIDHFEHYYQTAQEFGVQYSKYHQPDTLLNELVAVNDKGSRSNE